MQAQTKNKEIPSKPQPARILLVEDDTNLAEVISARLEYFGYTVCAAVSSGAVAIRQYQVDRPDIILMDILLEGEMNGIEAAEKIRAMADVPIVFLSCLSDRAMMDRAIQTKPFAYLVKPYNDAELRFTIENSLLKYRAAKERERLIGRLEAALQQVKQLSGLLPICSACKKIRDPQGCWQPIEVYIATHSEADFSHGICPECIRRLYPGVDIGGHE